MVTVLGSDLDITHEHDDKAQAIIRYAVTDGVHSHIHRIHANVDPTINSDNSVPDAATGLYANENDTFQVLSNLFHYLAAMYPVGTFMQSVDSSAPSVSSGTLRGTPTPTLRVQGSGGATPSPASQVTYTFRDKAGAPASVRLFGVSANFWHPEAKEPILPSYAGNSTEGHLFAYLLSASPDGAVGTAAAPKTSIVSHNGQPFAVPLGWVSTLNNRLRRAYKLR